MVSWIISQRGVSITTCPRASSFHGVIRNSSVVPASAARASAALLSSAFTSASLVSSFSWLIADPLAGATSSSFFVTPIAIHCGIVATMLAR